MAVSEFIRGVAANEGRTVVVTNKRVRCALTGENAKGKLPVRSQYNGAEIAHFGAIRGTNEFENHDVVIILGREQLNPRDAERLAKAIWYDTRRPIDCITADKQGQVDYPKSRRPYIMRDGSTQSVKVKVHPDRRVQAVVEQIREAEMVQAIDRLRLIHSPRKKTVYILCSIPLGMPVDALVTWRELTGDGRLAQALEACEENGWEALPLAAEKLSDLLPELWGTESAAEGWLRKNRLNPCISLIRLWAVFVDYKPKRQRRWSKALVRHGADPRSALAAVLGMGAEDIQVREPAGSEPPAKAITVPKVRPTNDPNPIPTPNSDPAADPSIDAQGSPAGDN